MEKEEYINKSDHIKRNIDILKMSYCFKKWEFDTSKISFEAIIEHNKSYPIHVHDNYILATSGDPDLRKVIRRYSTRQFLCKSSGKKVTFYILVLPEDKELSMEIKRELNSSGALLVTHLDINLDNNFTFVRISKSKLKREYEQKDQHLPNWSRRIAILKADLKEFTNKKNQYMPEFTPKFFLYTKSDNEIDEGANSSLKSFLKRHVKKEFEQTEIKPKTEQTEITATTETVEPTKLIKNDVIHEFFRYFVLPRTLLHTSKLFYNSYAKPFLVAKPNDIKALMPSHFPIKSLYDNNYKRDGIDYEKSHGAIKITFTQDYLEYTKGTMEKRQRLELPVKFFLHALHKNNMGHTVSALKFLLLVVFSMHTSRSSIICKPSTIIKLCEITEKRGTPYQVKLLNNYLTYLHTIGIIPTLHQLTKEDLIKDIPLNIPLTKLRHWIFKIKPKEVTEVAEEDT